ncbi:unnamed protein product [Notodromas monacha]|uniref:Uncharacterized protein n=1 Tax=Notodromas monacha TaxID=399045 RepID=A0A7R9BS82_9CRUS|nr:unnamed protein product [Notodromas monacha]CAG0919243.1 unnamed protein product [Notodromas monacha]
MQAELNSIYDRTIGAPDSHDHATGGTTNDNNYRTMRTSNVEIKTLHTAQQQQDLVDILHSRHGGDDTQHQKFLSGGTTLCASCARVGGKPTRSSTHSPGPRSTSSSYATNVERTHAKCTLVADGQPVGRNPAANIAIPGQSLLTRSSSREQPHGVRHIIGEQSYTHLNRLQMDTTSRVAPAAP